MIRTERAHLMVTAQSHPGMTGKNNEDRYAVSAYRLSRSNLTPALFAILCDGVGGHRAGEVAAEIAVDTISLRIADSNPGQPIQELQDAIITASQKINERANSDEGRQGMGSTCACTWIIGNRLYTASIGDSRIYLLRKGSIHQLTTDHTWIQEALDAGLIDYRQIHGHPNAHVIRRYLGSPNPPQCDFRLRLNPEETDEQALANQGTLLIPGDRLLLCSDGLTDLVSSPEIEKVLQMRSLSSVTQTLIDMANQRGGHDNITLILLEVPELSGKSPKNSLTHWIRLHWWLFAIVFILAILLGLGVGSFWLGTHYLSGEKPTIPVITISWTAVVFPAAPGAKITLTPSPVITATPLLATPSLNPTESLEPSFTSTPSHLLPTVTATGQQIGWSP